MTQNADHQHLTVEKKRAQPATTQAIKELQQGKGKRFDVAEALFEDLDI